MLATLAFALMLNQPAPATPAADQIVCRSLSETGTRLLTRVCLTEGDWAALKAEADDRRSRNRPVIDRRRPGPIGRG
jgi:hypothetical protein